MHISATAHFAADPARVYAMQTDEAFLEDVCRASDCVTFDVGVEGNRTHMSRSMAAPDQAKRFVGETITIIETYVWGEAATDGSRTADLTVEVPGTPAGMTGTAVLSPTADGSQVVVEGELVVNIPLLGKKLEQAAAPALTEGIEVQESVAREYLAR